MQDAVSPVPNAEAAAGKPKPALPLRSDTMLGVCEAIGEDFGFNPLWLRILFAASFCLNPPLVIGTYLGLGAAVALSRLLYPVRTPAAEPQPIAELQAPAPANQAQTEDCLAA